MALFTLSPIGSNAAARDLSWLRSTLGSGAFAVGPSVTHVDDRIFSKATSGAPLFDSDRVGSAAAGQLALLAPTLTALSTEEFQVF